MQILTVQNIAGAKVLQSLLGHPALSTLFRCQSDFQIGTKALALA